MDPISNMLTKIRNALQARHEKVDIPMSKIKLEVIKIFKNEGFIKNFRLIDEGNKVIIRVFLKYTKENLSVINGLKRVSKSSLRVYKGKDQIPRIFNGLGVTVVSTSKGVLTGRKAKRERCRRRNTLLHLVR